MKLTNEELNAMYLAMTELDYGPEVEIEIDESDFDDVADNELYEDAAAVDFYYEDDGQPTEYEEWQDVYGGESWV